MEQRWREIEEAVRAEQAEGEVEGGHEAVASGPETLPAEEVDEITPAYAGEAPAEGEGKVEVEVPKGTAATPQEVEGFDKEVIAEYHNRT